MSDTLCIITVGSTIANIRRMLNEHGIGFDMIIDICDAVADKPEDLQNIFLLRLQGETQGSIANKLGVSRDVVTKRINRRIKPMVRKINDNLTHRCP